MVQINGFYMVENDLSLYFTNSFQIKRVLHIAIVTVLKINFQNTATVWELKFYTHLTVNKNYDLWYNNFSSVVPIMHTL